MYKVLITTSGTGSRLWDMTKETNKSLLPLGDKLIISHLIDSYPIDVPIVLTVGYFGQKVVEETKKLYPDRDITFVTIDKYEWLGSSLAYSMLQAKDHLKCPFVFHACDTIIKTKIPAVEYNRVIGYNFPDSTQYTTFNVEWEYIKNYNKWKWAKEFDYVHIGLVGIHDYQEFWEELSNLYKADTNNGSLNDVVALSAMIDKWIKFKYLVINDRLDTGNVEALAHAQKNI